MITRMIVKFDKNKDDAFQGIAVKKRLEELINQYGDRVVNKIFETRFNLYEEKGIEKKFLVYYDLVVYYNDNYENLIMKALRPYWAL